VSPLLPASGVGRLQIKALVRVCFPFSGRSPFLDAAFRSSAATPALQPVSATASPFPAYIFGTIPKLSSNPFGPELPAPSGFLLPSEARSLRGTRCWIRISGLTGCSQASTPHRDFSIPPDQSLNLFPTTEACPNRLPDLPSLPATLGFIRWRCGSSFQFRYCLPGSLSFEPIGTRFIMHPFRFLVNWKISIITECIYLVSIHL